jgi:hypothetical protein
MSILLAAVFSISSFVLIQIRIIKGMGDSVIAFYAADTGAEAALYDLYHGTYTNHYGPVSLDGSSSYVYEVWITQPVGGTLPDIPINNPFECLAQYYCIKSIGTYNDVRRAVEVSG